MRRRSFLLSAAATALLARAPLSWAGEPATVAVLYFENQGNPELEPLKVGLAQMLITDLTGTPGVRVVERSKLQAILDELDLGHSGKVHADTAAKVGELLGAQWLILGSYFEMMGTLRIDARLVRVESSEIVASHGVDDAATAFMGLEKQLAGELQSELNKHGGREVSSASPSTRSSPGSATPSPATSVAPVSEVIVAPNSQELQAAVAFSEGLIYLDKQDLPRAREAFESAVAMSPEMDLARAELASMEI